MNKKDRDNLNFLMSVSEEGFKKWYDQADDEDIAYAFELILQHQAELDEIEMDFRMQTSDLAEAKSLLEKFKL